MCVGNRDVCAREISGDDEVEQWSHRFSLKKRDSTFLTYPAHLKNDKQHNFPPEIQQVFIKPVISF